MKKITFVIFLWIHGGVQLFSAEHTVSISGSTDLLKDGDAVVITTSPYAGRLNELRSTFTVSAKQNSFALEIPGYNKPRFIQIQLKKPGKSTIGPFLLFPGDGLAFSLRNGEIKFNGLSAKRFQIQQQLETTSDAYRQRLKIIYTPEALALSFARLDSSAAISLRLLEAGKTEIGEPAYMMLKNNVIAGAATSKLGYLTYTCLNKPADVQEKYITSLKKYVKPFKSDPLLVIPDSSGVPTSPMSAELIYQQYLVDSCILVRRKFDLHHCFLYESRNFKDEIREQLLTELFMMKRNNPELNVSDIGEALVYINNPEFRAELEKIKSVNTAGVSAPDFLLKDNNNRPVRLTDFRGKLVIIDFWFSGCGACKVLASILFKLEKKYEDEPVVFLSVSIDKCREQWLAALKTNDYSSPLAKTLYTEGKGDQHPVIRDFNVHGYPTIIVVDKEGKICPRPALTSQALTAMINHFL